MRHPTTTEYQRVLHYARRIKAIDRYDGIIKHQIWAVQRHFIDDSALAALFAYNTEEPLFQNLRRLRWSIRSLPKNSDALFARFLCPRLTRIQVDSANAALLSSLSAQCRDIEHVSLDDCSSDIGLMLTLRDVLPQWSRLQEFHCRSHLDIVYISVLSQLPNLTVLDVVFYGGQSQLPLIPRSSPTFPKLSELVMTTESLSSAIPLIALADYPALNKLGISCTLNPPTPEIMAQLMANISQRFSHTMFEHLTVGYLRFSPLRRDWDRTTCITSSTLSPLFKFSRMKTFICICYSMYNLDNSFLEHVAESWRELETFHLDSTGRWPPSPPGQMTLEGLVPFARYCPSLISFTTHLEGRVPSLIDSYNPGHGVYLPHLRTLGVGRGKVSSLHEVAAFLSDVTPNVERINCVFDPDNPDSDKEWEEVRTLTSWAAKIRAQERHRSEGQQGTASGRHCQLR